MDKIKPSKLLFLSFLFTSLIFISLSSSVLAEELNLSNQQKSELCIQNSMKVISELNYSGFSINRVNDTINDAKVILEIQKALASRGSTTDYSRILSLCKEIDQIKSLAFELKDEIRVLEDFFNSSSKGINSSDIDLLFLEIDKEMTNERYELVPPLIEKTYSEITLAQSRATTLNVFYDATTRGLKRFLVEMWKEIVFALILLIVLFFSLKKPLQRRLLKRSLGRVELRKKSLKEMITKNQDIYFNQGKISEETFTIKNKKLAELIRDIDRQISILREQLYRLDNDTPKQDKKKNK
jgi:hypothetical protein